ncbi:MAG: hypothetical protein WBE90_18245, partial [Xanthobacteraceae bacterium]
PQSPGAAMPGLFHFGTTILAMEPDESSDKRQAKAVYAWLVQCLGVMSRRAAKLLVRCMCLPQSTHS